MRFFFLLFVIALLILPVVGGQDRVLRRPLSVASPSCNYTSAGTLVMWYRLNTEAGLNNNDPIVSLTDNSGNGIAAAQGTSGARPIYQTNQINGLPAASFDGIDDVLSGTLPGSYAQPNVLFIVAKELTGSNHMFDGSSANRNLLGQFSGFTLLYAGALFNVVAQSVDTWRVYEAVFTAVCS